MLYRFNRPTGSGYARGLNERVFMAGVSLVLEGGGYRGQFTAGVLDVLLENKITGFDSVYGVSAGALIGVNFLSQQPGRVNRINLAFRDDKRYMGFHSFFTTGNIMSPEFLYRTIQNEIDPFDYETFNNSPTKLYAVVSNVETAQPEYKLISRMPNDIDWVRASATLPVISKKVKLDGKYYLDGGFADAVPIERAINDGNHKIVVVLTQHRSFVKQPYSYTWLAEMRYEEYPLFLEGVFNRHLRYNAQRETIFSLERSGHVFVIAPPEPVDIKPIEHAGSKLLDLYIKGRKESEKNLDALCAYLEK